MMFPLSRYAAVLLRLGKLDSRFEESSTYTKVLPRSIPRDAVAGLASSAQYT